jgi:hypothetical protein
LKALSGKYPFKGNNGLKTIVADIFNELPNLYEIYFEGNQCINKKYLDRELAMKEIAKSCKLPKAG